MKTLHISAWKAEGNKIELWNEKVKVAVSYFAAFYGFGLWEGYWSKAFDFYTLSFFHFQSSATLKRIFPF